MINSIKIAPNFIFKPLFIILHELRIQFDLTLHLIKQIRLANRFMQSVSFIFAEFVAWFFLLLFLLLGNLAIFCIIFVFVRTFSRLYFFFFSLFIELLIVFKIEISVQLSNLLLAVPLFHFLHRLVPVNTCDSTFFCLFPV